MAEREPSFTIEILSSRHDRRHFKCGVEALDRYLQSQASQDRKRRICECFVAVEPGQHAVAGFYTLAAAGVALNLLDQDIARKLPRYPLVPAVRLGRLAVDSRHQGQRLGELLVADAIVRALRSDIMAFAMIVDAKSDRAADFYRRFGFLPFQDQKLTLSLPLANAAKFLTSL